MNEWMNFPNICKISFFFLFFWLGACVSPLLLESPRCYFWLLCFSRNCTKDSTVCTERLPWNRDSRNQVSKKEISPIRSQLHISKKQLTRSDRLIYCNWYWATLVTVMKRQIYPPPLNTDQSTHPSPSPVFISWSGIPASALKLRVEMKFSRLVHFPTEHCGADGWWVPLRFHIQLRFLPPGFIIIRVSASFLEFQKKTNTRLVLQFPPVYRKSRSD